MKKWNLPLLFFFVQILQFNVFADDVFKNYSSGRFDTDLKVNYFNTTSNFAANGSKVDLPSGYSFQTLDTNLSARYVLFKDFGLFTGANFGYVEAKDYITTRKNSSLNSILGGADYLIYKNEQFSISVDLLYNYSVEKVRVDTDTALNNDGSSEVRSQLTGLFFFDQFIPFGQIGLNYRLDGLSTLLTYTAGLEVKFETFAFGGAFVGYTTVVDDQQTDQSYQRDLIVNRVDAFSKKYYAVNPNFLDSDLYLKYFWSPDLVFKVNGGYSVMGSNAANGYHVGLAASWGFGGYDPKIYSQPKKIYPDLPAQHEDHESIYNINTKKKPVAPSPIATPDANPQPPHFQEDTNDGVNQNYFKSANPSAAPLTHPVNQQPSTPVKKINRRQTVGSEATTEKGYKIKLKKVKKKKPVSEEGETN